MDAMILPMSDDALVLAERAIADGEIVAFPTDTVYGVGCDPFNTEAILKIYEAKGRGMEKSLPILLSDVSDVERVASEVPPTARILAEAFWPGALTLVVPRQERLPRALTARDTVGLRIPNHDWLRELIRSCGGALAATSANLSGEPDALDAQEVLSYLGDKVRLVVDGGRASGGVPSTVVDCTVTPPAILRVGFLSEQEIRDALAGSERRQS